MSQWVQVSGIDENGQRTLHRVFRLTGSKADPTLFALGRICICLARATDSGRLVNWCRIDGVREG